VTQFYSTTRPKTPHEIGAGDVKNSFVFQCVGCDRLSLFCALSESRDLALPNTPETAFSGQCFEGAFVRPGHPGLRAKTQNFGKKRSTAIGIKVSGNFIQQQQRAGAFLPLSQEFGVRQDKAEKQRFLFAR
jgi:hypothetical protein